MNTENHQLNTDAIKRLAISDSGFIFDPAIGKSYTANASALWILRQLQQDNSLDTIEHKALQEFDVNSDQLERDLTDFFEQFSRYINN